MKYRLMGKSGLRVSELALGAMTFGAKDWGADKDESRRVYEGFREAGGNFIDTMLRLAGERDEIGVVADQRGNPTSATDIAAAALAIATKMAQGSAVISGTWHFVNSGSATWHDLAALVFAEAAKRGRPVPKLRAITTADYPTPTRRPANSCLDTSKFTRDFGIEPRSWQAAITDIMDERLDNHAQTKARQ